MSTVSGCSEIVECTELNSRLKMNELIGKHWMLKPGQVCSVEDDINKLFESMDKTISARNFCLSDQVNKDNLRKRAMKRPMGSCSKIGFSDAVSLKQAFRGLSIAQASEMAAIKRLSKQANSSRTSNSVSVINKNLVDTSLVPEKGTLEFYEKIKLFPNSDLRNRNTSVLPKVDEISRSQEKAESSGSSKSSISGCRSSTSTTDESTLTGHRPHTSKGKGWEVIRCFLKQNGCLGLKHFKLIKKLGGGDIGDVYLAELVGTDCLFALKIMDNEFLISQKKLHRAETERDILQMLDHPFLPSLLAHFTTDRFSVLVMNYSPGDDLHALRKKQPKKSFSEKASRFYVAEVILALEYLHMLGIVYRDLKPEKVLVREDGHIILSDFDLSLRCSVSPMLQEMSPEMDPTKIETNRNSENKCMYPLCFQPTWQVPCFTPGLLSVKSHKHGADMTAQLSPLPRLVAEPTNVRSNSFVGTYEYLAPEIIRGEGHGSAIDWWTLGIFLYELIYGKTPFKGSTNEESLLNVVSHCVQFPPSPDVSSHMRDLISGLLAKDPKNRLGSVRGASEIKQHLCFKGINWALVRCTVPPDLPSGKIINADVSTQNGRSMKLRKRYKSTGESLWFEMF